ncbi:MAG: hypothetical protein M3R07_09910 [Gemmatimonadota bacterium]|nr:hypothetical protein [Gemmatimonadota bacterium]
MRERHGFALAAALAAMVLIAVLITGILFSAGQESRTTRHAILDQQTFAYAELAASRAIESMSPATFADATAGDVITFTPPRDEPLESTVIMTKLDTTLVLVVAEGRIAAADALRLRRRVEIVVRFTRDSIGIERVARIAENAWSALY